MGSKMSLPAASTRAAATATASTAADEAGPSTSSAPGAGAARVGPVVPVSSRVYARIGLLGNPSDGFYGKTISVSLENFYAEVKLTPKRAGAGITFVPHPQHDRASFASLGDFTARVETEGFYGGVRLLMSALKVFNDYCRETGKKLPPGRDNFTLSYDTNIPRQAGLSGSSAIACAALNCLFSHYCIAWEDIPLPQRPNLVLSVEQELGITAGLQDRVIQVYGGVVYMDFERSRMKRHGCGRYEPLSLALLPRLYLVWASNPSDSGRVHSDVKRRWAEGDATVREKMELIAACAEEGRAVLEAGDLAKFAELIDRNFNLRREIYGDAALGATNIKMITTARSVGAVAKFTGSGGAILAFCPLGKSQEQLLVDVCKAEGFCVERVKIAGPTSPESSHAMKE